MTQTAITAKLEEQLAKGITSEAEALYFVAEVRKLLELQQVKDRYEYLTFHCDWALHAKLQGRMAQEILAQFDRANIRLKTGLKLHDLPGLLRIEIDRISKMQYFEDQTDDFLKTNGLRTLDETRADGWIHFLHLYGRIVEDCPLVIRATNASATLASVTLKLELAKKKDEFDTWFMVRWIIEDKNGKKGEIFVINSFSTDPEGRDVLD